MSGEAKAVVDMIVKRLDRIEGKVDDIIRNGCGRGDDHAALKRDIDAIRLAGAESRGKWVVIGSIFGVFSVPVAAWLFKRVTGG